MSIGDEIGPTEIPVEIQQALLQTVADTLAPLVGLDATPAFLEQVRGKLQAALEPYAGLPEMPQIEVLVMRHPTDRQRVVVKFARVWPDETI